MLTFYNFKKNQHKSKKTPNEKINVLLVNFKQESLIAALYPTVNLVRGFIIFTSLVCLRAYPKITLVIWLLTSFFILLHLIIFKPFYKFRQNINQIGCECFSITMYLMAAYQAQLNQGDVDEKSNLGFRMLQLNNALSIWITMFSYLEIVFLVIEAIIEKMKSKKKEKSKVDKANPEDVVLTFRENSLNDEISSNIDSINNSHRYNVEVSIQYYYYLYIIFT